MGEASGRGNERWSWRTPPVLLVVSAAIMPLSFATWQSLLNNFVIERAAFGGEEIGLLQSLREVPGFLAFLVVYLLLFVCEQRLALISLAVAGVGTALTGYFPSVVGLYITTVVMSLGFHYFETAQSSLALQWFPRDRAAEWMGRLIASRGVGCIVAYGGVALAMGVLGLEYVHVYLVGGGATVLLALVAWRIYPRFEQPVVQRKGIVLRRRYWLYYALTFLGGARRQIFVVFAGFLLVEKFSYGPSQVASLLLANHVLNLFLAPRIGRLIGRLGERRALTFEYMGLILVFLGYAVVDNHWWAAGLFVLDHLFFAMAIAIKTYFQKVADPADFAASAGVAFTINHIAAVVIPVLLGLLWVRSPSLVFVSGACIAAASLLLARNVPRDPSMERVFHWSLPGSTTSVRSGS